MRIPTASELFDTSHTAASGLFEKCATPIEAVVAIKEYCIFLQGRLGYDFERLAEDVFVAKNAKISDTATICGPTVIGHYAEIRPSAYIRGAVIIGNETVIGNSTEIKNSVIFDGAKLPHFNYAGDSIVGYRAHLGAGVILSNLRLDKKSVRITDGGEISETGLKKMGALIGDGAEIGCNSVIYPGSIIGRECIIYPLSRVSGILPHSCRYGK